MTFSSAIISISLCRCACSRVPAFPPARRLRAPLCTSFTWGGVHHWDACASWVQNTTRVTSRIPSHSDADLRRNTKPGLGKRWIAIDLRDCLRIVVGLPLPQLVFGRWSTTKKSIKSRTIVITRRNFVRASATAALAAGLPFVSKPRRQPEAPDMNPDNTFWPNSARMIISVSMQMEGGAQPTSGAESPRPHAAELRADAEAGRSVAAK